MMQVKLNLAGSAESGCEPAHVRREMFCRIAGAPRRLVVDPHRCAAAATVAARHSNWPTLAWGGSRPPTIHNRSRAYPATIGNPPRIALKKLFPIGGSVWITLADFRLLSHLHRSDWMNFPEWECAWAGRAMDYSVVKKSTFEPVRAWAALRGSSAASITRPLRELAEALHRERRCGGR
jgi:hypothetical protein